MLDFRIGSFASQFQFDTHCKMILEKLWNFFFNFICIAGCAYQVGNVVNSYFQYQTVTKNRFHSPTNISFPQLHYCFVYLYSGLDWSKVIKKYGKVFEYEGNISRALWMDVLTIKDILEWTPKPEIESCLYRDHTGHEIIRSEMKRCSYFTISKYVNQQYICYHLKGIEDIQFNYHNVYSSLLFDSMIYEIRYSNELASSKKIRVTLTQDGIPFISRYYALSFYKKSNTGQSLKLSCQKFKNSFLGYPYDAFLCAKDPKDFYHCMESCLSDFSMKTIKRQPFSSFYEYPEDSKLISEKMLKNATIKSFLDNWNNQCRKVCIRLPCEYSYCITSGHAETHIDVTVAVKGSAIRIQTPAAPMVTITYVPKLPFLDFFIYILSTFGTWFGLVIIQCNPMKLFKYSYDIHQKRCFQKIQARINVIQNRMNRRDAYARRMMMEIRNYETYCRRRRSNTRNIVL